MSSKKIVENVLEKLKGKKPEEVIQTLAPDVETAVKLQGAERKAYLEALDQAYGDRAKRAKDLGFSDETYYHGSFRNIDKFNTDKASPEGFLGKSVYTTNDPVDASENYAKISGPDVKNKIERLVDQGMDYDKAVKKIAGRVESGAIYPLKIRKGNMADLDSKSDYIDLAPTYDDAGDIVEENPKVAKIVEGLIERGRVAGDRLGVERNLGYVQDELYEPTSRGLYENVRKSMQDVSDEQGQMIGQDLARGALEDAGFNSAKVNARKEFNMSDTTPDTEHVMLFDPKDVRSTNAAFDPRFKDSPYILAATGSQKPQIGLGSAASAIGQAFQPAAQAVQRFLKPVDEIRQRIIDKLAATTDISGGKDKIGQEYNKEILNIALPDATDAVPLGKIGKIGAMVTGKGAPVVSNIMKKIDMNRTANALKDPARKSSVVVVDTAEEISKKDIGKVKTVGSAQEKAEAGTGITRVNEGTPTKTLKFRPGSGI